MVTLYNSLIPWPQKHIKIHVLSGMLNGEHTGLGDRKPQLSFSICFDLPSYQGKFTEPLHRYQRKKLGIVIIEAYFRSKYCK